MKKYFVIGDIHGCSAQLDVLLRRRELFYGRRIIFLGDYVDIGPDSKLVIQRLLEFRASHPDAFFLRGNHDVGFQSYVENGDFVAYAQVGGIATIRSYCGEVHGDVHAMVAKSIPLAHMGFLASLETYLETDEYLFSHAGYSPKNPFDRSNKSMVLESHQTLFSGDTPLPKIAVCGHYFQRTHRPFMTDRIVCLDTGCGILGGPLTAASLPERRLIQVSPDLDVDSL